MATAWELAIPVAGTLLGAVVGSGSQLLLRKRQERHERTMRLVDEKLRVYSRLLTLMGELAAVERSAVAAIEAAERYRDVDLDELQDPKERRNARDAIARAAEESREAYELSSELVRLLDALRVWAPHNVVMAALELRAARRREDEAGIASASDALVKAIRQDLSVDS